METIEMRLQKLEATNRRYKRIVILMIAVFATFFMAFRKINNTPDVLQAKRFEVVDDNGNVLVRVSQDEGKGLIKTFNSSGKKLVNITYTTKNEGFIGLEDGNDKETIRLTSSSEGGGGYIGIYNPTGNRTLTMCNEANGGSIYVNNSSGNNRALLQSGSNAGGYLSLLNSSGYAAVKLWQTSTGHGDIFVNNYLGDERLRLSVSSSAGNILLSNNSKTKVVEIGGTNGENGVVNTYNSSGTFVQGIGSSY